MESTKLVESSVYQILNDFLVKTSGLSLEPNTKQSNSADSNKQQSVKTVMLIHGWAMNSYVWEPIKEALEAQYHVVWIDLPGHGFNRHVEANSLTDIVSLLAKVIPADTHIIAWSLGGLIAQALAIKTPDKIKSLTLVASTPKFSQSIAKEDGDTLTDSKWLHAMSDDVLNRFADNLIKDTEKTIKGFIALQFIGIKNAKAAQDALIAKILNYESTEKLKQTRETKTSNRLASQQALSVGLGILKTADLRNIKTACPEHWIFAEYDRLIPKQVINDLISIRPDAQITLLKKAGHASFVTHTNDFLEHATHFINKLN